MTDPWFKLFVDLKMNGKEVISRGLKTLEIENYPVLFTPKTVFCNFKARDLSLKYIAGEFAWYLSGDRSDLRIEEYSSFWKTIRNAEHPYYNSNYGYHAFTRGQFDNALCTLIDDKGSRQAIIVINDINVAKSKSKDKLCTNAIMFRIRDSALNMTVQMRSNDVVYGLGNDAVLFSFIHQMLYLLLLEYYPTLTLGMYYHNSASMHIYERHFDMMDEIIRCPDTTDFSLPRMSSVLEALYFRNDFAQDERFVGNALKLVPRQFTLARLLLNSIKGE